MGICHFIANNNLADIWRTINPDLQCFSWFKPKGTCKSRIDYWLGSYNIVNLESKSVISNAPLSDHYFIELHVKPTINK